MSLVDSNWLEKNLNKVKIIDCSWHMPHTKREGLEEYNKEHIPNAIFFDLDKNSKIDTDLPHMLTDINSWELIMNSMGISNEDEIVIYIINKNNKSMNLDTERFIEIEAIGKTFTDIHTDKTYKWSGKIQIKNNSSLILTNK